MTLTEYCDALNIQIVCTYIPNQDNRWTSKFYGADVREGNHGLLGVYGNGKTAYAATVDYYKQIKGRTIVFHAMSETERREYKVPENISL